MERKYPRYYRKGKSYKLTPSEIVKIKELRSNGWTQQRIADEMDISPFSVAYHTDLHIKERIKRQALERYKMMSKEEQREARNRNMSIKRNRQKLEMRLYKNPDAKTRKISNEQFLKLSKSGVI